MLALQDAPGVVSLVNPATGKVLTRLTLSEPAALIPFCFTRDGSRLVCVDNERESLQIFDLRRLRSELVKLDLDWDAPPCPETNNERPKALEVEVDGTDMTAKELNEKALRLVTAPVDERNPARALQLVQEALKQQPANPLLLNTLGAVQYRRAQYAEAVRRLRRVSPVPGARQMASPSSCWPCATPSSTLPTRLETASTGR